MPTLRVAAIQVESHDGAIDANLARADATRRRSSRGRREARRVPGVPRRRLPLRRVDLEIGRAPRWTDRALAHGARRRASDLLGASYLEADGDDFFNTFALAAPDGSIAGRVRKESLPVYEGWYFKSCTLPKTIDTALGRIAVGICQDNHTARFMRRIADASPDLILMPHSAPCAPLVGRSCARA